MTENNQPQGIQYPNQALSFKRPKKIISFDAAFAMPAEGSGESPMEMSRLSRFVVSIIDSSNSVAQVCRANIPVMEFPLMFKNTDIAVEKLLSSQPANVPTEEQSSVPKCYTTRLIMGPHKNKTPAEVLLKDTSQADNLRGSIQIMEKNLDRYPANAQIIDAIKEALQLLEIGELHPLDNQPETNSGDFTIYSSETKYFSTKDEKGNHMIYQIKITCLPGRDFPFYIEIMNGWAPVATDAYGRTEIKLSAAYGIERMSFAASLKEWYNGIAYLDDVMSSYLNMTFPGQWAIAKKHSFVPDPTKRKPTT